MTVLLLAPSGILESDTLAAALKRHGGDPRHVTIDDWPGAPLSIRADGSIDLGDSLGEVTGVYAHTPALFTTSAIQLLDGTNLDENAWATLTQLREHRTTFESLVRILADRGATVLPSPDAIRTNRRKPLQLERFRAAGLPTPETLVTTEPTAAEQFCERHGRVVYKPVGGGAPPAVVTSDDLDEERLAKLRAAPVQFQSFVPGDDLRVYVLDGSVIGGMRYESERFSFKLDQAAGDDVTVTPVDVGDDLAETTRRAADTLNVRFGAVDLRQPSDGTHTLLELNQAPAFAGADETAELGVADALAELLID